MGPQFYAVRFDTTGKDQDIWMALLSEWPFESFHQENDVLTAYIEDEAWTKELEDYVDGQTGMWFNSFKLSIVPYQNWNEIWESSFNPVAVDQYCYIRAQFHDPAPKGYKHEMVIAPKMAFGTGHHATTYMMLQAMSKIEFTGKSVLDYGCGTGILSVVAAMEGAREVTGIDIQPEALDNSLEHAVINHVESVCHFYMEDLKKSCVSSLISFWLISIQRSFSAH